MSAVVLRCPSCGTTKAAPGECDACHEAQVRYYCTRHTPGRWLDSPSCTQCGSQFGVADPPAAPPPPRRAPRPASPAPPSSTARPPPPGAPAPAPRRGPGYTLWPPGGPWSGRRLPGDHRETRSGRDTLRDALEIRLPELLREAARARRTREVSGTPPIGVAAAGCLRAAVLIVLFFMLALFAMSILLGGVFLY
jgi:hypothetical protein